MYNIKISVKGKHSVYATEEGKTQDGKTVIGITEEQSKAICFEKDEAEKIKLQMLVDFMINALQNPLLFATEPDFEIVQAPEADKSLN